MGPVRSLLLVNGPRAALYYIGPQMSHVIIYPTGCILGRAPVQRRLCSLFVKLWAPIKETKQCGIRLPDIHKFSSG